VREGLTALTRLVKVIMAYHPSGKKKPKKAKKKARGKKFAGSKT
jgi:hypothetical protein